jgi:hypothetical protein
MSGPPITTQINNRISSVPKGSPFKDVNSDSSSSFAMGRMSYTNTYASSNNQNVKIQKKWFGNKDASQVTKNRKISNIALGSLNLDGKPTSDKNIKDNNVIYDALIRTRNMGYIFRGKIQR